MDVCHAAGDRAQASSHMVSAVMPPATFGPSHPQVGAMLTTSTGRPRETASDEPCTPRHNTRRSDSSPPMGGQYGPMVRMGKRGMESDTSHQSWDAWDAHIEAALNRQRIRFDTVAEEWVARSKYMLRSDQNEWRQHMISEERYLSYLMFYLPQICQYQSRG